MRSERSAMFTRDRAENIEKETERLKIDSSVSSGEVSSSCQDNVNSIPEIQHSPYAENVNSVLEIQPARSDPPRDLQDEDSCCSIENHANGMSPYNSGPWNFWPILGLAHHQSATYKLFVIGAYFGKGKPFSVDLYLEDFIAELNFLCKHGLIIKGKKFEIRVKFFCCDGPARSFLKCCNES
ncbi:hypothetical protein QAD02_022883 [Eretmocerus hayati]|uniref:Uncharacterized protein n=1 Tax=Eretmocerus hayati TaxID=131215 RepID=A0ACC2PUW3_9HYME|nr:hypothetical protein QAD02_022883 [Eretmocerus hayati]